MGSHCMGLWYGLNRIMYKKDNNVFEEWDNSTTLMKVQYKDIWYDVFIDTEDVERVRQKHWRTSHKKRKVYIVTGQAKDKTLLYLHNFLMNYTPIQGWEIDHQDGNSLNNRKENLKLVTRQDNISNSQTRIDNKIGIRGIVKTPNNTYQVDFSYHKKRIYFPKWKTIEEAVYCRKFVEEYYGLSILDKNPLAHQYLILSKEQQQIVKNIVLASIAKATV